MKILFLFILVTGILLTTSIAQKKIDERSVPLADMTLHIIPQSHIDLAWWWRYNPQTIHIVVKHTLETAFKNLEKFPDYTFTFLQVPAIEPLEVLYPELFYKLRYYVHDKHVLGERIRNPGASGSEGRLAIGSGLWCEVDGCLPCGESLVRQCLYGKRYYQYQFGIDVRTAWFQDAWTHPWTYPQILKKSGIDSYMFTRPRGEGEYMFWWQSPDGSKVFAYKPLNYFGENLPKQKEIDNYLVAINRQYGIKDGITLVGVGNHGGGAIQADVDRMKNTIAERQNKQNKVQIPAQLVFSNPTQFVQSILDNEPKFPVINYELTPTIRGAYTTVGEIKRGNRYSENLLLTLEKFSTIASWLGDYEYPRTYLFESWKDVLLNQFHDTISGTDIPPSIDDALRRYSDVLVSGREQLFNSLKAISSRINTQGSGIPLLVFNPLAWERTDVVQAEITLPQPMQDVQIVDNLGIKISSQIINQDKDKNSNIVKLIFIAEKLPSLGYSCFWVNSKKDESNRNNSISFGKYVIENEFFKIQIDSLSGCIQRILDKQYKREVLDKNALGNLIQILADFGDSEGFLKSPEGESEYNLWTGETWNLDSNPEIELLETGPVRQVLQIKKKFKLARFIQKIILYHKIRRIDFDLIIDWQGKNKMVKIAFPLNVRSPQATYEIPYGTIQRPSIGEEHVAQKWVDISKNEYGVSLLNDSRYGYDIKDNFVRLSVLRSPDKPVNATDEIGVHNIKYGLYPHSGNWQEANVTRRGYEFNYPLIALADSVHNGDLPAVLSFIEIEPENLVLTVLKRCEDSDDVMIRFYETNGENGMACIILSDYLSVDAVHKADLLENPLEDIQTNGKKFTVPVGKFAIESYKLIRDID